MVPRAVLMMSGLVSINTTRKNISKTAVSVNTARQVNTAPSKTTVNAARPMTYLFKTTHSTVKRPVHKNTTFKNSNFNKRVNTIKDKNVNTVRPKAVVNAARSKAVVNVVKGNNVNAVKASTSWVWKLKTKVLDHVSKHNSALITLKKFDYVDAQGRSKKNNMYSVDLKNIVPKGVLTCLFAKATSDESKLWHRSLGHLNFKTMNKLVKGNLVRGLPSKLFENEETYVACQKGKQHRASFVTDDYSRFTWVFFLATKDETSGILKSIITGIQNLVDHKVKLELLKNRVAKRRNRTLIEADRTMLADSKLPTTFWAEAVNTNCYVQNRMLVVKPHNKTSYELFHGRTPTLSFMRPFGCPDTILNTIDHFGKFDGKADEGFFVGYSLNNKAFRAIVAGTQSNGFEGTKASDNAGQARKEIEPVKDYILLPLWIVDPPFS
ncbi:putative ribonuclease H-like domain-containing protein [Tanacetum coccineum]|uniref:Ribonuclease H-like domain-containing protein n=1 Tax=Tanacetum coccineum TaxID=301880 RepID=A0ABQ5IPR5_9ASTR